jgi:hypothetical protein
VRIPALDRLASHRPCPRCGFPVQRAARRCPDCGERSGRWPRLTRQQAPPPLQATEATLSATVSALLSRRGRLEQSRDTALARMRGASGARTADLSALISGTDEGLAQIAALIARCNEARRATALRRAALVAAALTAEWSDQLSQTRPQPPTLGAVAAVLRWTEPRPWQAALISPSGRWLALAGGGKVLVVDLWSGRARSVDATGASGLQFSADERLLRFPDGRLWGVEAGDWLSLPAAWIPPVPPRSLLPLDALPHDVDAPAPDPRWRIASASRQLLLTVPGAGWQRGLLALPGRRGLHLEAGVLLVSEPDTPRLSVYQLRPAPGLRWDAWALRDDEVLGPLAAACIAAGLVEELALLSDAPAARAVLLVEGAARLGVPELVAVAREGSEHALASALAEVLRGEGDARERAAEVERLGRAAAAVAAISPGGRAAALAEQAPSWADALLVEAASGALDDLVGGGVLALALGAQPGHLTLPAGAGRLEEPDPEAALSELEAIQRDLAAQLSALSEVEGRGRDVAQK